MIRAAAATGAAAWTVPVIIDSLSSPAAAGSCVTYYAKLDTHGNCIGHDPSCGLSVAPHTRYVCCSSDTSGEDCPWPDKTPTLSGPSGDYYKVTLPDGCTFLPLPQQIGSTGWRVVANYDFHTPCPLMQASSSATKPSSGDGRFQVNGNVAWVNKKKTYGSSQISLTYIYLQFCCTR